MRRHWFMGTLACSAAVTLATLATAADPTVQTDTKSDQTATAQKIRSDQEGKILAAHTFRASKLIGMNVRNEQGEELGSVDDIVIDVRTGKVQYVAMSVGTVLGLGGKLLAVPFDNLQFDHGQDEMFFVLNMSAEKVAAAPGFDEDHWPNLADPDWTAKINKHYRQVERRTSASEDNDAPRKDD